MRFIYVFNSKLKKDLESKGFKYIQHQTYGDKDCWVFENSKKLNFDNMDKNDFLFCNRLNF